MVFWALVSLLRGNSRRSESKSTRDFQERQTAQQQLYRGSSFERRSVYAYSIMSANTNRNWRKRGHEPVIVPTVEIFTKIMEFLPPHDSAKLLRLCQLWSGPAAEALYTSPPIVNMYSFPKLVALLSNQDTIHPYSLLIREFCFCGSAAQEVEMGDLKQALQSCTNLVSLRMEGCSHLSSLLAQFLKEHAPFLSRVEFPGCHISDSFLQQLIRGVRNLRHIDVCYTSVSLSQLALLVRECQYLETLCMSGCQPSPEEDVLDYEASEYYLVGDSLKKYHNSSLKEVEISNSLVNDAIVGYLARHSQNLESIILEGCSLITDNAVNSIAMYCPNIKLLNLSYCHITDLALQSLAIHLSSNASVLDDESIPAERTRSYSTFSEYQPPVKKCTKKAGPLLEVIVLTGCKHITRAGITFLASKCPRLEKIVLDGCHKLTDWYLRDVESNIFSSSVSVDSATATSNFAMEQLTLAINSDTDSFLSAKSELEVSRCDPATFKLSLTRNQVLALGNKSF